MAPSVMPIEQSANRYVYSYNYYALPRLGFDLGELNTLSNSNLERCGCPIQFHERPCHQQNRGRLRIPTWSPTTTMCRVLPGYWADSPCCRRLIFYPQLPAGVYILYEESPLPEIICTNKDCGQKLWWHVHPVVRHFTRYCDDCRPALIHAWPTENEHLLDIHAVDRDQFRRFQRRRFREYHPQRLLEDTSHLLRRGPTAGVLFNPLNPPPGWDRHGYYVEYALAGVDEGDASVAATDTPDTERQFYPAPEYPLSEHDSNWPDEFSDASSELYAVWAGFANRRVDLYAPREFHANFQGTLVQQSYAPAATGASDNGFARIVDHDPPSANLGALAHLPDAGEIAQQAAQGYVYDYGAGGFVPSYLGPGGS